jgi:hypothetical protein
MGWIPLRRDEHHGRWRCRGGRGVWSRQGPRIERQFELLSCNVEDDVPKRREPFFTYHAHALVSCKDVFSCGDEAES